MEDLLKFFYDEGVALQITLDVGRKPVVHAIQRGRYNVDGLHTATGNTLIEALKNMEDELFNNKIKAMDRVTIINDEGEEIGKGTVININFYREESMRYAVDVDDYSDDVLFFGESQLIKD